MLKDVLRDLINEWDITVASLARKTGVPKTNINSWLQGSSPNLEQLYKVAQFFNVTLDYMATGEEVDDPVAQFMDKFDVHTGMYEITVKKVTPKNKRRKK
jgi:transcriptional regulator with XRE-family HTH domain